MDCIFCKIIAGEIPAFKVYEDEAALAFMDINPLTEGHLLVVPKKHVTGLFDGDEETLAVAITTAAKIARTMKKVLGLDSLNMIQANGPWAMQSVPHLHLHLVPRREGDGVPLDWEPRPGDMEAIGRVGEELARAVD